MQHSLSFSISSFCINAEIIKSRRAIYCTAARDAFIYDYLSEWKEAHLINWPFCPARFVLRYRHNRRRRRHRLIALSYRTCTNFNCREHRGQIIPIMRSVTCSRARSEHYRIGVIMLIARFNCDVNIIKISAVYN